AGADDVYRGIRTTLFAGYFQDDWKVRSNFILNLGVRYEPITSPDEVNGKISNLRDLFRDQAPMVGRPFFKNNTKKNFGPRVGFAWDITGSGKMSLRGGYGIFFAHPFPAYYRFEMSNQAPFAIIGLGFGAPFPNGYSQLANVPGFVASQTYEFD